MQNDDSSQSAVPIDTLTEPPAFVLRQDLGDVRTLADDMVRHGQLCPVIVRRGEGTFELIAGHRRIAAARLLQWTTIHARVLEHVSDEEALGIAIAENERRKDFTDPERALLVRRLDGEGRTAKEIAALFTWSERTTFNWLSVSRANKSVWDAFASGRLNLSLAVEAAQTRPAAGLDWSEILSAIEVLSVRGARRLLEVAAKDVNLCRRVLSGRLSIDEAVSELQGHDGRQAETSANAPSSRPSPSLAAAAPKDCEKVVEESEEPSLIAWVSTRLRGQILCGEVAAVCFLRERLLAVAGMEGWITVYDIETRREVKTLVTDALDAYPLAAARDGSLLAYPTLSPGVALWDVASDRVRWEEATSLEAPHSMAFDPEGRLLAVGHRGGVRRVWDVESGVVRRVLTGCKAEEMHVAISGGRRLVSGGSSGGLRIADAVTGKDLKQISARFPVGALAAGLTGLVAVGSGDAVWLLKGLQMSAIPLQDHAGQVRALAFSPSGRVLVSAGKDGRLALWDVLAGVELDRFDCAPVDFDSEDAALSLAINVDGSILAVGTSAGVSLFSMSVREEAPPSRTT